MSKKYAASPAGKPIAFPRPDKPHQQMIARIIANTHHGIVPFFAKLANECEKSLPVPLPQAVFAAKLCPGSSESKKTKFRKSWLQQWLHKFFSEKMHFIPRVTGLPEQNGRKNSVSNSPEFEDKDFSFHAGPT